ncbi:hypothetical protein Scep_023542 [Stephania cephalantha]|uniref:EDR1/CTR1/ARMC3-like peptidase-like domain-containing protein n=1 Tax=Stephania cephalantha TaxID=152367 RepID=A0AAP0F0A8_9MAGN
MRIYLATRLRSLRICGVTSSVRLVYGINSKIGIEILYKVLADQINLPFRLVKGSYNTGSDKEAINFD